MFPYQPPLGHENNYLTYGKDSLRVPFQCLSHCTRRPVRMYPSHLGCEHEAAIAMNRFCATDTSAAAKKRRAQFICIPLPPDIIGRHLIEFHYVGDVSPSLRIKPNLFHTWFPEILNLKTLPGHVLRVCLPDPRLSELIVASAEEFRQKHDGFVRYSFKASSVHGGHYLSVERVMDATTSEIMEVRRGRPRVIARHQSKAPAAPKEKRIFQMPDAPRGNSRYTHQITDLKYIGASFELSVPKGKVCSVRRCIRQWCDRYKPDLRCSVVWDKSRNVVRVTRVAQDAPRKKSTWPYTG